MYKHQEIAYKNLTPEQALMLLKEGNFRFVNNLKTNRDLLHQVNITKDGQYPFAALLSCMDSRTSVELIFDQGLGDIFSIRVAGNVISEDVLGSIEFAVNIAGSKLIVVLGHTSCGAIKGACDDVKMGNLTHVMEKIKPAVMEETTIQQNRNSSNAQFVNEVARLNVWHSVERMLQESEIISRLLDEGKIAIVPAMYDVANGVVNFYDTITSTKKSKTKTMMAV
jgi:carbonic anhydrase